MTYRLLAALVCVAFAATPAHAQRPEWDPTRKVLVVTSPLDSTDAEHLLEQAFRDEGLEIERSDTARGRLITVRRPSDTYGNAGGTLVYAAMVLRLSGGSRVVMGGLIQANPNNRVGSGTDVANFARGQRGADVRQGGDLFFLVPGTSREWQRLEHIANVVQAAGH